MSEQSQSPTLSRPESVRDANEQIVERAIRLRFVSRVPLLCECSQEGCGELVLLTVDRYRQARGEGGDYLTAPSHIVLGAAPLLRERDHWLQQRTRPTSARRRR